MTKVEVLDEKFNITYRLDVEFHRNRLGLDGTESKRVPKSHALYSAQILWRANEISKEELVGLGMKIITEDSNMYNENESVKRINWMNGVIRDAAAWAEKAVPIFVEEKDSEIFLKSVQEEYKRMQKVYPLGEHSIQDTALAEVVTDEIEKHWLQGNTELLAKMIEKGIEIARPFAQLGEKHKAESCLQQMLKQTDE